MPNNKICDFCLDEVKGLFKRPEKIAGDHYICKNCKSIIQSYDLPVRYELFQILVTSEPTIRQTIMYDYLENHTPDDIFAKYYPLPNVLLHQGEQAVNVIPASITVNADSVPEEKAETKIIDITKNSIHNLPDDTSGIEVQGMLYETNAALYFLSENFINCHRLTSIAHSSINEKIQVMEHGNTYTYSVKHADLFFLREQFYDLTVAKKNNKQNNLIYLKSENTMTLTPGVYSVPNNVQPGTYYVESVEDKGIHVRDVNGKRHSIHNGRLRLDEGNVLEVTGEYTFRINPKTETVEEDTDTEKPIEKTQTVDTAPVEETSAVPVNDASNSSEEK